MPAFQVRVFRTEGGYLAWIDGLGTVEGRTLAEIRRESRRFLRTVIGGAFPDRPAIEPAGAAAVLQFDWEVRLRAGAAGSRVRRVQRWGLGYRRVTPEPALESQDTPRSWGGGPSTRTPTYNQAVS